MLKRIVRGLLKILFEGNSHARLQNFFADDDAARCAIDREMAWHFRSACHDYKDDPDDPPMYHDPFNDIYL